MNIFIETYGCSANINESEIMAGLLQQAGFEIVQDIDNANLIILNSCVVKSVTEQRLFSRIGDIQKNYPDMRIIIAGCAPEVIKNKIMEAAPGVSFVSTHHIKKIALAAKKVLEGKIVDLTGETNEIKLCLPKIRKNPVIDIVPISSGCLGECTYCITRLAKGRLFSYPKSKILQEIEESVKASCKEIWLTAQDTGAYEIDTEEVSQLPDLLKDISKIQGNFSVRVGMMNPSSIMPVLSELIESYNSKKIYKFLHLPVQSGSDKILKSMNRFYTVKDFEEVVSSFRDAFRCTIWTDIIVGYPGETEDQFKESLELIKRIEPDYVNISRFAKREGTPASKLQQLNTEEMKRRTAIMTNLVSNVALKKNKEWIGWTGEILITERGKKDGQWIGRNFAYKSVVINKSGDLLGKTIEVKIVDAIPSTLVGWPVKD